MPYKTTRDVDYNGKRYAEGKPIPFTDDDLQPGGAKDQLLALDPPAIIGSDAKPLERMSKAELADVVADEGVEVAADATNAQIIDAIKAKRAEAGAA